MHYFEFHFQKFIAATKGWKDDEVGAFVKLLIEQFDSGFIPDNPEELGRLITTYKKNWPRLAKKFTEPSESGQLRNTFMCKVRSEAHEKSAKNAANGAKGGRAKKANATANATANAIKTLQRNGSQPITSNQEPVKEKIEKEIWDQYPTTQTPIEITDDEIQNAIEFLLRLGKPLLTAGRVLDFWAAFRLNLCGDFYQNRGRLIQHFRNWLKDRDLTEVAPENSSTAARSTIENRNNAILDQFSR